MKPDQCNPDAPAALPPAPCSATVVLRSATAWYKPSTEFAWISGYLCQRWYPSGRNTIHQHPEWVAIPEMDKYSQPIEPEQRKSPNSSILPQSVHASVHTCFS